MLHSHSVGVNISIEKILLLISTYEQKIMKKEKLKPSITEVLIVGNTLENRIEIASELWSIGIKTEYIYSESLSQQELYSYCKNMGISWIVIIKDKTLKKLLIKHVENGEEIPILRADLATNLLNYIKNKKKFLKNNQFEYSIHSQITLDIISTHEIKSQQQKKISTDLSYICKFLGQQKIKVIVTVNKHFFY